MHHERTIFGTLRVVERLNNSPNGNPRYRVHVETHDKQEVVEWALTKPDADLAYGINNHDIRNVPRHWKVGVWRGHWHVEEARALYRGLQADFRLCHTELERSCCIAIGSREFMDKVREIEHQRPLTAEEARLCRIVEAGRL